MKYDIDYFIAKFTALPENQWCTENYVNFNGQRCVLGHCGDTNEQTTDESRALCGLFLNAEPPLSVVSVNDGISPTFTQDTPKERILAACHSLKENPIL